MGAIGKFVEEHPFLTFFIATAAIDGVVTILRGPRCEPPPPPGSSTLAFTSRPPWITASHGPPIEDVCVVPPIPVQGPRAHIPATPWEVMQTLKGVFEYEGQYDLAAGLCLTAADIRRADGSYAHHRPPGHGLLAPGETRPDMNAVQINVHDMAARDYARGRVGDEVNGVPIVYSVFEEWSKMMPTIGRPLADHEMPGWG